MGIFQTKKKIIEESSNSLTKNEIELILRLLGTTHFPVKDIEILYKALYKLQEEHNRLSSTGE